MMWILYCKWYGRVMTYFKELPHFLGRTTKIHKKNSFRKNWNAWPHEEAGKVTTQPWSPVVCQKLWNIHIDILCSLYTIYTQNKKNVGFEVLSMVAMKSSIFWDITLCSLCKVNWCSKGTCHLQAWVWQQAEPISLIDASRWFSCLTHSSTLQMEVTCLQNVSWLTIWHYIPEDITLQY
jgi:hypothetical protein